MKKQKPFYMSAECWVAEQKAARLDREAERSVVTPKRKLPVPVIENTPLTFQPPVKSRAEIVAEVAASRERKRVADQKVAEQAEGVRQRTEFTLYRSRKTGSFWRKAAEVEGHIDQMEQVSNSDVSVQENGTALWNGKTVQIVNI
jgi:hypothetical protein